jgi:flagellar motor component MotA
MRGKRNFKVHLNNGLGGILVTFFLLIKELNMDKMKKKTKQEFEADDIKNERLKAQIMELYKEYRREGLSHLEAMDKAKRTMACFKEVGEV